MQIVFIGAGNVATHLAEACKESGNEIVQVYSRTMESATLLAGKTGAMPIHELKQISPDADLYLFSVKDDVLPSVIQQMPHTGGVWAHTAGSLPMQLFAARTTEYGVIYPLQTFSKQRKIDFASIPLFIEGSSPDTTLLLEELARTLSRNVRHLSGEKRRYLHLAAVYACNFVNHMYTLAAEITGKEDIPFELLIPLITETAAKVTEMTPQAAQTGPAVRFDEAVMQSHLSLLTDQQMKDIYILISKNIYQHARGSGQPVR
jgi:predicted short-subunit dehydrogenase-like oxidoreductase (DUF2520 family)